MDYKETVPERFRVTYDKGVFRILDCWHDTIRNINDFNVEIPDNSPALTIITTEEVNALIGRLSEMGWLDKMITSPTRTEQTSVKIDIREAAIDSITKLGLASMDTKVDDATLAKEAITAIKGIVGNG